MKRSISTRRRSSTATESPGGQSNEIDFRNLNLNTSMVVDVNGVLGNGIGQVPDTDSNWINLTTTITAHELGHTLGLRHEDAFGPIGFGISNPPGDSSYYPAYPGLTGAFTTDDHIITSPAAVGSTLENAADGDAYFGEREAISLAFIYGGTTVEGTNTSGDDGPYTVSAAAAQAGSVDLVNEGQLIAAGTPSAPAETLAEPAQTISAQPVSLYQLSVPNSIPSGFDAGKSFDVDAVDVLGHVASGTPNFYTIQAPAGSLMSFETKSADLTRITDPIDTVLYVYGPNGALLAWNDDQFEPSDSSILDLTLPAPGTYTVEVDSYQNATGQSNPPAGDYELFMYRFSAYSGNGSGASATSPIVTSSSTPTFSGTAPTAGMVTISTYSGTAASETPVQTESTTTGAANAFSFTPSTPLANGTYTSKAEENSITLGTTVFTVNTESQNNPSIDVGSDPSKIATIVTVMDAGGVYDGSAFAASGAVTDSQNDNLGAPAFTYYLGAYSSVTDLTAAIQQGTASPLGDAPDGRRQLHGPGQLRRHHVLQRRQRGGHILD